MRSILDDVVSRRLALGAAAAGAAGFVLPGQIQIRAIIQRGVFGGGLVTFEHGDAQFSLFASKLTFNDDGPDVVVGSVVWIDGPSGQSFISTAVSEYEIVESTTEQDEVRTILGTMSVDNTNEYPFRLTVTDGGFPGIGVDSVALIVGSGAEAESDTKSAPAEGFSYAVAGTVVVGDVRGIDVDIEGDEVRDMAPPA